MKDVEAFHEAQAMAAAGPDVFNGEGPGECMGGVGGALFHPACLTLQAAAGCGSGPDVFSKEGPGERSCLVTAAFRPARGPATFTQLCPPLPGLLPLLLA